MPLTMPLTVPLTTDMAAAQQRNKEEEDEVYRSGPERRRDGTEKRVTHDDGRSSVLIKLTYVCGKRPKNARTHARHEAA